MGTVSAITCPRCGGVPDPEGGPGFLARCTSCGVLGRIDDPEGGRRLVAFPAWSENDLLPSLRQALESRGLTDPHLQERELLFVPFWRFEVQLVGQVKGERLAGEWNIQKETSEEGSLTHIRVLRRFKDKERVHREVQKTLIAHVSACPLEEIGLPTLDSRRQAVEGLGLRRPLARLGRVEAFHPGWRENGTFLDPLVPLDRAEAEAAAFLDRLRNSLAGDLLPGAATESAVVLRQASLLYYPLLALRFTCGAQGGGALFDASAGSLISLALHGPASLIPERRLVGLGGLVAGAIAGSLIRAALFPPALVHGPGAVPWQARLFLAGVAVAGAAFWALRCVVRSLSGENP